LGDVGRSGWGFAASFYYGYLKRSLLERYVVMLWND